MRGVDFFFQKNLGSLVVGVLDSSIDISRFNTIIRRSRTFILKYGHKTRITLIWFQKNFGGSFVSVSNSPIDMIQVQFLAGAVMGGIALKKGLYPILG